MVTMNKLIVGILSVLLPAVSLFAADTSFQYSYGQGKKLAEENHGSIGNALGQLNPNKLFDQFQEHPDQEKAYVGVLEETSSLNGQAIEEAKKNPVAIKLRDDFNNRPEYKVDTKSDTIKNSQWMIDHADEVTLGNSCKAVPVCETAYEYKQCQEEPSRRWFDCQKTLNVTVDHHVKEKKYSFTVHLDSDDHYYIGALLDVTNGRLIDHGPRDASAWLDGRLPSNIDCRTLQSTITGGSVNSKNIDGINFPSCNGLTISIHVTNPNKRRVNGTVTIDVISRTVDSEIHDNWVDTCGQFSSDNQCKMDSEQCTHGMETKKIDGIDVTRECWQQQLKYTCLSHSNINNSCEPLRKNGCEQIGSVCHTQRDGMCLLYDQTLRCPIKSCTGQTQVICTKEPACINGNCTEHQNIPDTDFNQAVGGLGALTNAASQMDKNSMIIFSGSSRSCSLAPVGFLNC
jgi:conjugal transfer mating pair stabilization protein TraN